MPTFPPDAQRFQDALRARGLTFQVKVFDQTTHTSKDAARAIGCSLGQIAKSLIFRLTESGAPLLVIASGPNRVDEAALAARLGQAFAKADPDFVFASTGYAVGGVPPACHSQAIRTLIDEDLLKFDLIWAAAGASNAVFPLTPAELLELTGGQVVPIKEAQG
jgi:prolyl-tRNA editing enzyme YbaK/EbsC (Cys-tRNA(Pro) deacylase)